MLNQINVGAAEAANFAASAAPTKTSPPHRILLTDY